MEIEMPLVYITIPTAVIILNSVIVYCSPSVDHGNYAYYVLSDGYVAGNYYNVNDSYGVMKYSYVFHG